MKEKPTVPDSTMTVGWQSAETPYAGYRYGWAYGPDLRHPDDYHCVALCCIKRVNLQILGIEEDINQANAKDLQITNVATN